MSEVIIPIRHIYTPKVRNVRVQYENNLANAFRDIVRKPNTDTRPEMLLTISPALLRGRGIQNRSV